MGYHVKGISKKRISKVGCYEDASSAGFGRDLALALGTFGQRLLTLAAAFLYADTAATTFCVGCTSASPSTPFAILPSGHQGYFRMDCQVHEMCFFYNIPIHVPRSRLASNSDLVPSRHVMCFSMSSIAHFLICSGLR